MKLCKSCGTELKPRSNEHPSNFKRRKLCNTECRNNYMRKNRKGFFGKSMGMNDKY